MQSKPYKSSTIGGGYIRWNSLSATATWFWGVRAGDGKGIVQTTHYSGTEAGCGYMLILGFLMFDGQKGTLLVWAPDLLLSRFVLSPPPACLLTDTTLPSSSLPR